jgi:nucleoside-diphosphate-sugar epimerase
MPPTQKGSNMSKNKTVFIAGASGAIGKQLSKILVNDGWTVVGTTRDAGKAGMLKEIGVIPVIVDVFDEEKLAEVVNNAQPEIVIHQLTDLPYGLDPEKMADALVRNAKLREIGTRNLVAAATAAGAKRMIAQSIAFVYEPGTTPFTEESPLLNFEDPAYGSTAKAVASLEQQVLDAPFDGLVLRYGLIYGPGTGFDNPLTEFAAPVHVDAAANAARLAIEKGTRGIYNITEQDDRVSSKKAEEVLGWTADFRLAEN